MNRRRAHDRQRTGACCGRVKYLGGIAGDDALVVVVLREFLEDADRPRSSSRLPVFVGRMSTSGEGDDGHALLAIPDHIGWLLCLSSPDAFGEEFGARAS